MLFNARNIYLSFVIDYSELSVLTHVNFDTTFHGNNEGIIT